MKHNTWKYLLLLISCLFADLHGQAIASYDFELINGANKRVRYYLSWDSKSWKKDSLDNSKNVTYQLGSYESMFVRIYTGKKIFDATLRGNSRYIILLDKKDRIWKVKKLSG